MTEILGDYIRTGMIGFREGVTVADLVKFYNDPKFNDGKPLYHSSSENGLRSAGVVFVKVPDTVKEIWKKQEWKGDMPNELPLATDMLVTLAGLDGLEGLTDQAVLEKARVKTLGDIQSYGTNSEVMANYLEGVQALAMTNGRGENLATALKPNQQVLREYVVIGIVPAPLLSKDNQPVMNNLSLNIPHGASLGDKKAYILGHTAYPEAVKQLYASFLKQ